jgi:hypothetical protein
MGKNKMTLLRRLYSIMNKWQAAVDQLIKESGVTVRRWRKHNSGVAYTGANDWGVEIPVPKGPVSFCIAAHEIGHQVKHRKNGRTPRWVEEVEAWEYALAMLERFELPDKAGRATRTATKSLDYSFGKAFRRGVSIEVIRARFPEWMERIEQTLATRHTEVTT